MKKQVFVFEIFNVKEVGNYAKGGKKSDIIELHCVIHSRNPYKRI